MGEHTTEARVVGVQFPVFPYPSKTFIKPFCLFFSLDKRGWKIN